MKTTKEQIKELRNYCYESYILRCIHLNEIPKKEMLVAIKHCESKEGLIELRFLFNKKEN